MTKKKNIFYIRLIAKRFIRIFSVLDDYEQYYKIKSFVSIIATDILITFSRAIIK